MIGQSLTVKVAAFNGGTVEFTGINVGNAYTDGVPVFGFGAEGLTAPEVVSSYSLADVYVPPPPTAALTGRSVGQMSSTARTTGSKPSMRVKARGGVNWYAYTAQPVTPVVRTTMAVVARAAVTMTGHVLGVGTHIGPWTVDVSQTAGGDGVMTVEPRLVAPVAAPPAGQVDPVTGDLDCVFALTPDDVAAGKPLPPVTAYPASPVRLMLRTSPHFPDPATCLVAGTGRPDPAVFKEDRSKTVQETLGRLRVVIGGRDVTFFRGGLVHVTEIRREEPFGSIQAQVRIGALTPFEDLGTGDTAWLTDGANVDIDLVLPGGATVNMFEGLIPSIQDNLVAKGTGVTLTCMGTAFQADYIMNEPPLWSKVRDTGHVIAEVLDGVPGRRYAKVKPVTTGIPTTDRGTVDEKRMERVRALLAAAWTDDGTRQWTVKESRRSAVLVGPQGHHHNALDGCGGHSWRERCGVS